MIRKFTLFFLLLVGLQQVAKATEDSVTIHLPFGTDTTCPGDQLKFWADHTNDTMASTTYAWYHNGVFTGVTLDTFYTTAPLDGDSVYCWIHFTTSLGFPDSFKSNVIIVHRSTAIAPRALISLTTGSNPDCPGHLLTFTAYPINGGLGPQYQWLVNGVPYPLADSITFTHMYSGGDVVSVRMISDSWCRTFDTAYSSGVTIVHDSLTATIAITAALNPICLGTSDTFTAVVTDAGAGYTISWFVGPTFIPGAVGPVYITDSLHDGDLVYAILHAPDPCVINDTTVSNVITMDVIDPVTPTLFISLTAGSNPGCLDSPVTFTATYTNFGVSPGSTWYVNGVPVATDTNKYRSAYADGDLVTFRMRQRDGGCYTSDSLTTPAVLMVRDSTPVAPLVSLIGNLLVANTSGTYVWYYNGSIIPGATGQTYHPSAIGYYYAIRVDGYCPSFASNTMYVSLLGIDEVADGDLKIYPNPSTGIINLDWGTRNVDVKVDVYSILGQGVQHKEINNKTYETLDLSYLPQGNYFIVVRDNAGNTSTYKVSLKK
jgi:hypothetical protein